MLSVGEVLGVLLTRYDCLMNRRTLHDLATTVDVLDVHCSKCSRRGRLNVAKLVERYGNDFLIPDLRTTLNAGCEHADGVVNARCDLYFPQLAR